MADLTALAFRSAVSISIAELHGLVCGLAVCGERDSLIQHLVTITGADALTDHDSVGEFVSATVAELTSEELSFAPLLPGDHAGMGDRLEAVAEWCAGFITGLGAGLDGSTADTIDDLPVEVREIITDFAAICEVDYGGENTLADSNSTAEHDLMQVEEYIKVGVLLILSALEREQE